MTGDGGGWERWLDVDADGYLPAHDHAARREHLQGLLPDLVAADESVALFVTSASNLRWATGFTGSNGALLLTPEHAWLLTDARYEGRAAVECRGLETVITRQFGQRAVELAAEAGADRLAFEGDHVSHRAGVELQVDAGEADLAVVSVHGVVERERSTKDDAELARIARACAITEVALDELLAGGLVGRTEREVATRLEQLFRGRDATVGFPTIVAAGGNGAIPHHEPTTRVIDEGDLVTIDCGARIDGYHADTTRTVAAGALPQDDLAELVEVFAVVAEAQEFGVAAATDGARASEVDRVARDHVAAAGYGEAFVHGTGHGVGLDIHEAPAVATTSAATLRPRTVLTVEPGIYLPGRGGVRIEDTVVVTADGPPVRLTNSPRALKVV